MTHSTFVVRLLKADGTLMSYYEARCVCGWHGDVKTSDERADAQANGHGPPMVPDRIRKPAPWEKQ